MRIHCRALVVLGSRTQSRVRYARKRLHRSTRKADRMLNAMRAILVAACAAVSLPGQWLNYPTPGIPRTPDGKPNLSAPTPKTADGKPDLSGIWVAADNTQFMDLIAGQKGEDVPYQPWAKVLAESRQRDLHKDDPLALCLPPGVPRVNTNVFHPFKILQLPR